MGNPRYLLNRDGRYFARLLIPKHLRQHFGNKTERRTSLGPDRREALRNLPGAIAALQREISDAERTRAPQGQASRAATARYPMTPQEIAASHYQRRLRFDEELRNADSRYAQVGIDEEYVHKLRDAMSGRYTDEELFSVVGEITLDYYRTGNFTAKFGTSEWRSLATSIAKAEYAALERASERDDGDWNGKSPHEYLELPIVLMPEPVSIIKLFTDYLIGRDILGKGRSARERWTKVINDLVKFLGHDDALKITKSDIRKWRDHLLLSLKPKTVSDVNLAAVRTVLNWAVENDRVPSNAAADVSQEVPRLHRNREKGYTTEEALKIIAVSVSYTAKDTGNPATTVSTSTIAIRRWVPILCALSGARVGEIAQLRHQDFRQEAGSLIMRISPDAGTVKTGQWRDVPLHSQILELGFKEFLDGIEGPLFYQAKDGRDPVKAAALAANVLRKWLIDEGLTVAEVAANHGWRHRFKTIGREANISDRVLDAICGHASKTAGDSYGDVTLATKISAIAKLPRDAI
jgi:integrase